MTKTQLKGLWELLFLFWTVLAVSTLLMNLTLFNFLVVWGLEIALLMWGGWIALKDDH